MSCSAVLLSAGKWRWFLTGLAFAVLFGLICRAAGTFFARAGQWRQFSGTCTRIAQQNGKTAVAVQFTDANRLTHTAAFFVSASGIQCGDPVRFAVLTEAFVSGTYPQTLSDAEKSGGTVLHISEYRSLHLRRTFRLLLSQLALCGAALAVFLLTARLCFPAG